MTKRVHLYLFSTWIMLLLAPLLNAQEKARVLNERDNKSPNLPIVIVDREVNGRSFENDGKLMAGPEWIRDLTLSVKNVSQKPIIKFQILLSVTKHAHMTSDVGMMFSFPQPERELDKNGKPTGEYKPLSVRVLQPGEVAKVQVWQHQLKILEDKSITNVELVSLSIRNVLFEDGTGWFAGRETMPDPDNPKGQIFVRPEKTDQSFREI